MVPMAGTNGLGLAALVDLIDGPGATWAEHAAEQDAIRVLLGRSKPR
jgi:hypothetical protein